MADRRKRRGPHPADAELFAEHALPALREAVADLSWLLARGYVNPSALKIVGDRHRLRERQRIAVQRATCTPRQSRDRNSRRVQSIVGETMVVNGYNLLTTIECLLGDGIVLKCCDGTLRDMASMHGTYRKVEDTVPALELIGKELCAANDCRWLLDQPVSNSGRLRSLMRDVAEEHGWTWQIELVPDPDVELRKERAAVVITADSEILDADIRWFDAASRIAASNPERRIVDLSVLPESSRSS